MSNEHNMTHQGPEFWLSLEQYKNDPEFAKRAETEFLSSPLQSEDGKDGFARREFLKLMGASIALATTACVRRPVQHIIPYAQAPKELTPGVPAFYTSTWFDGEEGYGLLVKTFEGRPIKLEGNPNHPMNLGALPARAHAEVLYLYDPDRLQGPKRNLQNKNRSNRETVGTKWEELDAKVIEELGKGGVAVLTSTLASPSAQAILGDFAKAFGARVVTYDALPMDSVREGQKRSYGKAVLPRYRLDKAKIVVSVDADFLGTYLSSAEFEKQWGKARKPGKDMLRLVTFESNMSLTGMNADDRIRIKPSQQLDVVLGLIHEIGVKLAKHPVATKAASFLAGYGDVPTKLGFEPKLWTQLANELWENRGKSLIIAGGLPTMTEEAVDLQVAVNLLNSILGNDGQTIDHDVSPYNTHAGSTADLSSLIADMQAGKVKSLIINDLNAMYVLPKASGFQDALSKVDFVVYAGNGNDETGKFANYVAATGTTLEAWGDYELQAGVYSIQQPTIRPMYDTRSFPESLHVWASKASTVPAAVKANTTWFDYVRNTWKTVVMPKAGAGKSFDDFWAEVLQQGVVVTVNRDKTGSARAFAADALNTKSRTPKTGYELVLHSTVQLADGKYSNVAWLQELPDVITKRVWDNYISVSPATARKEGLKDGDVIELKVGGTTLKAPVQVQPGLHDDVLAIAVGYGRTDAGKVGNGVGVDAFTLASIKGGAAVFAGAASTFTKTGEKYQLVSTQDHHSMEGRQIVAETTNTAWQKNPGSGIHRHKVFSIWPQHQYTKHRWAMSIDLNSCTGCSACVIACQSENNIPVVGKKYVMQGREMHWIRVDRYYKGNPENPETVFQPMLCQHCETAPCETVCPVLATVHNEEGLNDMVYNRCVGTRYCSNNCPYKVRRFNWFNYSKREAPLHMALNPEVTVRARGVMEKCSFCVQRIRQTTVNKKVRGEALADGDIKTACQQTCPSDAIIFGDLSDPNSRVSQLFQDQRTYAVLEDLNTQPRVRYMSRVRNAERAEAEHGPSHGEGHGAEHGGAHGANGTEKKIDNQHQHEGEHA
jgi:molybdopterin-containing oxidoreductase family iron-sulfur binding subunit